MAAAREVQVPELIDLWQMRAEDLEPIFQEEIRAWRRELRWDFQASADLVRRFVDVRVLNGYALRMGGEPAGYIYFVSEEQKGLIGDLFVRQQFRTADAENALLAAVIGHLTGTRKVRRIESQLMMARTLGQRPLPGAKFARAFQRNFMMIDPRAAQRLPVRQAGASKPGAERQFQRQELTPAPGVTRELGEKVAFEQWTEGREDETAQLIVAAYRGHIDSEINDQYRTPAGARRFLRNIVQYPGCGTFFQPASWAATGSETGELYGASLTSLVASDVGHITQICVTPGAQGTGVGYELLRRSLAALAERGAQSASLTVTAKNEGAVRLYERMGFELVKQFPALVWEGF